MRAFRRWAIGLAALVLLGRVSAQAQDAAWPPAPETLFAPGIEVVSVELQPTVPSVWPTPTLTPTPGARCGYLPRWHIGEVGAWSFDYVGENTTPSAAALQLCNLQTGERRELALPYVDQIAPSPNGQSAVIVSVFEYHAYHFSTGELILLGSSQARDNRAIEIYGDFVIVFESEMASMSYPWVQVSFGNIAQANSLQHRFTILKFDEVDWFRQYGDPDRITWIDFGDTTCRWEWLFRATAERRSFDLSDLCVVGRQLTDDLYGQYLFLPANRHNLGVRYADQTRVRTYSRDLVMLNLTTGEREHWFSGEVERIDDIDPSGRYVAMLLDDNGCIDFVPPDIRPFNEECGPLKYPDARPFAFQVALLDSQTRAIIYRQPVGTFSWEQSQRVYDRESGQVQGRFFPLDDVRAWAGGSIFSLNAEQFLVFRLEPTAGSERNTAGQPLSDTLLTVQDGRLVGEETLPGLVLLGASDGAYLAVLRPDESDPENHRVDGDVLLWRPQTSAVPLINGVVALEEFNAYSLRGAAPQSAIELERGATPDTIRVRYSDRDVYDGSVVYTVRVPGG